MRKIYATIHSVIESYVGPFLCVWQQEHDHRAAAEDSLQREDREDGDGSRTTSTGGYPGGGACGIALGAMLPAGEDALSCGSRNRRQSRGRERFASGDDHGFAAVPAGARSSTQAAPGSLPQWGRCAYTAAEKIEVPHYLASAGRSVPSKRRNGNRLRQQASGCGGAVSRPSPRGPRSIICKNSAAIFAARVSTPDLPPGAGEEKCDATVGKMIALLRYGTGMPSNRNETAARGLWAFPCPPRPSGISLRTRPSVPNRSSRNWSARRPQGDVLYNDDTTVKILGDDGPAGIDRRPG